MNDIPRNTNELMNNITRDNKSINNEHDFTDSLGITTQKQTPDIMDSNPFN